MPSMTRRDERHDIGKALILVLGALIVVPGTFSYYVLVHSLRDQNLCHIGPTSLEPNTLNSPAKFQLERASLLNLYGTYTTFDDASYYFVKTPYDIAPQVLPTYGYWSISTLALTLLSPKLRQSRQQSWVSTEDYTSAPSIQWDQSHEIEMNPKEHSSKSNRWCLLNHPDTKLYHKHFGQSSSTTEDNTTKQKDLSSTAKESTTGSSTTTTTTTTSTSSSSLFRICGQPQTSIISSGDLPPYFVELPLQAPMTGVWKKYETDDVTVTTQVDDDDSMDRLYQKYKRSRKPTNPYQLQVSCHVREMELQNLAHGSLQPPPPPPNHDASQQQQQQHQEQQAATIPSHDLGWEHAEHIVFPVWNVFYTPGTLVVLLVLLMVHLRRRKSSSSSSSSQQQPPSRRAIREDMEWNFVKAIQRIWFHDTWRQYGYTSFWVYLMGTCLEPLIGTFPYLGTTILFFQIVAITMSGDNSGNSGSSGAFLWVCFGQSVLLTQLEPSIHIHMVEISSIALGDSEHSLKINVLSVLIALVPMLQQSNQRSPWRTVVCCLLMGWALVEPLTMELLGAPQWTIPTLLLGHLWWKLTQLLPMTHLKKSDEETALFTNNTTHEGDEKDGILVLQPYDADYACAVETTTDAAATATTGESTIQSKLMSLILTAGIYLLFGLWTLLTIGCIFTMDWTLVVGNMLTIWLCIGTNQFPRHPLWSLYHMVASSIMIALNTMTLTGWYLCQVAITTHAVNALSPRYVYTSMLLQMMAHFMAFVHTVHTKHWETSRRVPGHYFWINVRMVGEEAGLWYHVFFQR